MDDSLLEQQLSKQLQIIKTHLLKMGASREDAEDIAQDTAYKFLLYIDSVDHRHADAWLFRVAINGYYDLYRKRSRRERLLKFNFRELFEETTPETAVLRQEAGENMEAVLHTLPPKHQQFLLLKYSVELSIKEIADLYQMKEDSVKTTLYRARKAFIQEYRRQGYE